jgi:hypothetical protein
LDGLAAVDVVALPAGALGEHIRELFDARNRLDGAIERAVGVFDAQGMGEVDGCPSTASWLRGRCRLLGADASARVRTARALRELPMIAAALEAGEISLDHARAVALLAHETDIADTRRVQRQILDVARLTDPGRFTSELKSIRDSIRRDHGDDPGEDETAAFARREIVVSPVLDGFNVRGWLPDEAGVLVKTVLDALSTPVSEDLRTVGQRCADAFTEVFRRVADGGALPANHGVRPHLFVVAELDALLDTERAVMAQLGYGAVASAAAARRIACDAVITRVLISPQGQLLDLGRTTRVVTAAQWKALVVRDGGCVFPGCDRPATWCQAHHLHEWINGGPTDLDNLALICGFHHRLVHEGHWSLRVCGQRWQAVRPDGSTITGDPVGYHPDKHGLVDAITNRPRGPCRE